jgi:ribosome-binding protein aMBF1 (putative translation factor)
MNNLSDGKKDLWEEITYLTNKRAQNEKKKKDLREGNTEIVKKNNFEGGNLKKFDGDTGNYSGDKPDLNLNKIIQQSRTKLNLKQKDIAKKLNIDMNTYNRYESGALKPDNKTLLKLQKILKVKLTGNKMEWGKSI